MKVTRQPNKKQEDLFDYTIEEEGKKLEISQGGKGDIYWYMDDTEPSDYACFTITEENEHLYSLFAKLYISIMRYQELSKDEQAKQMSMAHYLLTKNGNITWYSDKDDMAETDIMSISRIDDQFQLEFVHQTTDFPLYYKPGMFNICIAKDDSRYAPFNQAFQAMYSELQNYDPEYHQIHLSELAYQKRKSMGK